jgi:hypothetical protein
MSSTLSRSRAAERAATPPIPVRQTTAESVKDDRDDVAGFARAVAVGVAVGVPIVGVLIATLVKIAAPDMDAIGVVAIAIWVSLWIGVFLGGTVTVGLWSSRQH